METTAIKVRSEQGGPRLPNDSGIIELKIESIFRGSQLISIHGLHMPTF